MRTKVPACAGLAGWAGVRRLAVLCVGAVAAATITAAVSGGTAEISERVPELVNASAEQAVIEMFTPPTISKSVSPRYPEHYRRRGREGWVSLSTMVDPNGKAYDVTVIDSSGDAAFEKNAVTAAKDFLFAAAQFGSTTIDASTRFDVTFRLSGATTGTTKSFVRSYRRLAKAIAAGQRKAADKGLETLSTASYSLYDQAYWQLARYQYEQKWGTSAGEYRALRRAAFLDRDHSFLPADIVNSLLLKKLTLELEFSHFMRAQRTAEVLLKRDRNIEPEIRSNLEETIAWVDDAAHSGAQVVVSGEIADSNYYSHSLLRPSFSFRNVKGDIAELRLHCSQGYYGFIHKAATVYRVEPVDQRCELIAIGTPGTTFELVETQAALRAD